MEETTFIKHFSIIQDPRVERTKKHFLIDILAIAICAVICGAKEWEEIENYAEEKEDWLRTFLQLPNGVPSHDTFARVFSRLEPDEFQRSFLSWISEISKDFAGEIIAIDGKTLRGSHERSKGKKALHMVSAWATSQNLSLGQIKVDGKSNEITAVPKLLDSLVLKGAIVTLDAMGCQRKIAEKIAEKEADYIFSVKENQGTLYKSLENTFNRAKLVNFEGMTYSRDETVDGDHGRIETRCCIVLPLMYLYKLKLKWEGLKSLILIESKREIKGGEATIEYRYYISSLAPDAAKINPAIRAHWRIENNLHWCLDITFREDECRIRKGNSPENFSMLRRLVLSLLKQETSLKASLKKKQFKALMNNDYLMKVLKI